MYVLITFLEMNGVRTDPIDEEITRVGFAVASGKMGYEDLLKRIYDNEI